MEKDTTGRGIDRRLAELEAMAESAGGTVPFTAAHRRALAGIRPRALDLLADIVSFRGADVFDGSELHGHAIDIPEEWLVRHADARRDAEPADTERDEWRPYTSLYAGLGDGCALLVRGRFSDNPSEWESDSAEAFSTDDLLGLLASAACL